MKDLTIKCYQGNIQIFFKGVVTNLYSNTFIDTYEYEARAMLCNEGFPAEVINEIILSLFCQQWIKNDPIFVFKKWGDSTSKRGKLEYLECGSISNYTDDLFSPMDENGNYIWDGEFTDEDGCKVGLKLKGTAFPDEGTINRFDYVIYTSKISELSEDEIELIKDSYDVDYLDQFELAKSLTL